MTDWFRGDDSQQKGCPMFFSVGYASVTATDSGNERVDETTYLFREANAAHLAVALEQIHAGEVVEYDPTNE